MIDVTNYRFQLDKSSTKFRCPNCNHQRFVRYTDTETMQFVDDEVGRCDRENNCGFHLTPKEYFKYVQLDFKQTKTVLSKTKKEEIKKLDFIPNEEVELSMDLSRKTNFARYINSLFYTEICDKLISKYLIGSSSKSEHGQACIFWRIDIDANVRTGKVMFYDKVTGKRDKRKTPSWVHNIAKDFNYQLCFFGEHLLAEHPDKPVAIVESEKTAIVASALMPDFVWMATGGKSGCKWREYDVHKVLKDKRVLLFPDYGYANRKTGKTCYQYWCECAEVISKSVPCKISVSRILEDRLSEAERINDLDLVDVYIKRQRGLGFAVDNKGKVLWASIDCTKL